MGYSHTNARGVIYYLHSKGRLMFFSKKPEEAIDLPSGMEVTENSRTGLPMVRKKSA